MNPGQTLEPGWYLASSNGAYKLVMQSSDGNLVLYQGAQPLWSSSGQGAGASVTMQGDGNLVIYNGGVAKWSSNTGGFSGAVLALQDDANLVIYQGPTAIWDWRNGPLKAPGTANQIGSGSAAPSGTTAIAPPPLPRGAPGANRRHLHVKIVLRWRRSGARTQLLDLRFLHLPRGARVQIACQGRHCPAHLATARSRSGRAARRSLRGRVFRSGQMLMLRISAPGAVSEIVAIRFRSRRAPAGQVLSR